MYPKAVETTRRATAPPRSKRKTCFTLALRRLANIRVLLAWRLRAGIAIPSPEEILCLAGPSIEALAGMKDRPAHRRGPRVRFGPSPVSTEDRDRHAGLDLDRAVEFIASIYRGFAPVDRAALAADLRDAITAYDWRPDPHAAFTPSADYIGRALNVTRAERENLELFTMDSADEPAEARKARKAAEKREADRLRQRAKRRMAAAREGRITGGPTLEDQAPWVALGVSRRTYFRRKKAGDLEPSKPPKRNGPECDTEPSRISLRKQRGPRSESVTDLTVSLSADEVRRLTEQPSNVIDLEAFRRSVRRDCFARAADLLEEGCVMLREQSARLDREHFEREAGAAQARPADDREGAA